MDLCWAEQWILPECFIAEVVTEAGLSLSQTDKYYMTHLHIDSENKAKQKT